MQCRSIFNLTFEGYRSRGFETKLNRFAAADRQFGFSQGITPLGDIHHVGHPSRRFMKSQLSPDSRLSAATIVWVSQWTDRPR
jgi:hypothetical protein